MLCFCKIAAEQVPSSFPPRFTAGTGIALPQVPVQLMIAPALFPAGRLDMQIAAAIEGLTLPSVSFGTGNTGGSGGLMTIAPVLAMINGTLPLHDLPMLQENLNQAADTLVQNLWPMAGWLASVKMAPLLNFALAAQLFLNLKEMGIDPVSLIMPATPPPAASFSFALTRPQLAMARVLAGLPALATVTETLDLPALGDPDAPAGLQQAFSAMARITPPQIGISFPMLQKMALVLSSLAVINEAFGEAASTKGGIAAISATLNGLAGLPIPFPPLPALALRPKLDALPGLPAVMEGIEIASMDSSGGGGGMSLATSFVPPRLGFLPLASLIVSIGASMQLALDMPAFNLCDLCPC